VASSLKEPAVKRVLEHVEGVDQHAASQVVLLQTKRGGIVQCGGIDVHDKRWQRHDPLKAAQNYELVAFQSPYVATKVAANIGGGGVTAAVKVVMVVLLQRMLWNAGMFELNCNAALLVASERSDNWLLRNCGDDEGKQQQQMLCAHHALVEGATIKMG
jgi:hypothetical protein